MFRLLTLRNEILFWFPSIATCLSYMLPFGPPNWLNLFKSVKFVAFTCSKMQWCWFAPSHVFGVHIHRIHELLHPGNVSVSTGFKQLPEGAVSPAAARVTAAGVGRGAGTSLAPLRGGRGASAATAAAAAGREGRTRGGGGGRGRRCLTVSDAFHPC